MATGFDVTARLAKMRRRNLFPQLLRPAAAEPLSVPTRSSESDAANRLQVGLAGLGAMVLLVGVADMVMTRAEWTEEAYVPEAAT